METTIILGLYWDNGKENGNYHDMGGYIGVSKPLKVWGPKGLGFEAVRALGIWLRINILHDSELKRLRLTS